MEKSCKLDKVQVEQQAKTKGDENFEFVRPKLPERLNSGSFGKQIRDSASMSLSDPTLQV